MPYEVTFSIFFIAIVVFFAVTNAYIDRTMRERIGEDPQPVTAWSRRVESIRSAIEAQSLARFMRGEPPLDKDAELRRHLEVPEQARP